ncbi:MAG: hypothetical protein ACE5EA_09550 [Nitrospirota bacterium]
MKKIITAIFIVCALSTSIMAAESRETEEQAVLIAQTGFIHGELAFKSLKDMIKFFEQAIDVSDGTTKFKSYAKEAITHAKEALSHLNKSLKYANKSVNIKVKREK